MPSFRGRRRCSWVEVCAGGVDDRKIEKTAKVSCVRVITKQGSSSPCDSTEHLTRDGPLNEEHSEFSLKKKASVCYAQAKTRIVRVRSKDSARGGADRRADGR